MTTQAPPQEQPQPQPQPQLAPQPQPGPMQTVAPKSNVLADIVAGEHVKGMLYKGQNKGVYRPFISKLVPRANHSPFGDFPKEFIKKQPKQEDFSIDMFEKSQAASASNAFVTKGLGTGGKATTLQVKKDSRVIPPPKGGALMKRPIPSTTFRRVYDAGDLPVQLNHGHQGGKLMWKTKVSQLNYNHYLPIFFDGLREKQDPYRLIAVQGVFDMLEEGGANIGKVIPQLIIPIKTALNTRDPEIIALTLKVIQKLVQSGEPVGEMLVPYYRQILPIFNIYRTNNLNLGDKIEYGQRRKTNLGDLIQETLELLEQTGGEDAFINIKYMIPTYESCMIN